MQTKWKLSTIALGAALVAPLLLTAQASAQGATINCDATQLSQMNAIFGTLNRCDEPLAGQAPARLELHIADNYGTGSAGLGFFGPPTPANGQITWHDGQVSSLDGQARPGLPGISSQPSDLRFRIVDGPYAGGTLDIDGTVDSGIPGATSTFYTPRRVTVQLP
ncbi:hypothetical protein ACFXHA_10595 [Nocardia sp. NPDC059240]|uniref:hypothetical protein n=1 Tax=Nocardia sp. NPDC059240 TaxID=3346786 RepID=UPI00368E59EA